MEEEVKKLMHKDQGIGMEGEMEEDQDNLRKFRVIVGGFEEESKVEEVIKAINNLMETLALSDKVD